MGHLKNMPVKKYMQNVSSDARNGKNLYSKVWNSFFFSIFKYGHANYPKKLKLNRCCNERGVSRYWYAHELVPVLEGCRFSSYQKAASTRCLPACTHFMVSSN